MRRADQPPPLSWPLGWRPKSDDQGGRSELSVPLHNPRCERCQEPLRVGSMSFLWSEPGAAFPENSRAGESHTVGDAEIR